MDLNRSMMKSALRQSVSEPCLVKLGKIAEEEELRMKAIKTNFQKVSSSKGFQMSQTYIIAVYILLISWLVGQSSFFMEQKDNAEIQFMDESTCPTLKTSKNETHLHFKVDKESFKGTWHKIAWLRGPDPNGLKCSMKTVEPADKREISESQERIKAVNFSEAGYHFLLNGNSKLWVVDTDYESWAMLYTCSPHMGTISQQAFIVSRTKTMDLTLMGDIISKWADFNVPWKEFTIKEQAQQCL